MRHLLYIPDSKFITINLNGKNELSLEEYIIHRNITDKYKLLSWNNSLKLTEELVIEAILKDKFSDNFYKRYDLNINKLTREMFEVVDM